MFIRKMFLNVVLFILNVYVFTVVNARRPRDIRTSLVRVCRDEATQNLVSTCLGVYIDPYWVIMSDECNPFSIFHENLRLYKGGERMDCESGELRRPVKTVEISGKYVTVILMKIRKPFGGGDGDNTTLLYRKNLPRQPRHCYIYCNVNIDVEFTFLSNLIDDMTCKGTITPLHRDLVRCQTEYGTGWKLVDNVCLTNEEKKTDITSNRGSPIICRGKLNGFVGATKFNEELFEPITDIIDQINEVIYSTKLPLIYEDHLKSSEVTEDKFSDIFEDIPYPINDKSIIKNNTSDNSSKTVTSTETNTKTSRKEAIANKLNLNDEEQELSEETKKLLLRLGDMPVEDEIDDAEIRRRNEIRKNILVNSELMHKIDHFNDLNLSQDDSEDTLEVYARRGASSSKLS